MITIKKILSGFIILSGVTVLSAQEQTNDMKKTVQGNNEIASETTEKIYKITTGDQTIENSVKITTVTEANLTLEKTDESADDGKWDRTLPKKTITKTVRIDNDEDEAYDKKIVFSYRAENQSDFLLVTKENDVMLAISEGNELRLIEAQTMNIDDLNNRGAYVFTDDKGGKVEFLIRDYTDMNAEEDK